MINIVTDSLGIGPNAYLCHAAGLQSLSNFRSRQGRLEPILLPLLTLLLLLHIFLGLDGNRGKDETGEGNRYNEGEDV